MLVSPWFPWLSSGDPAPSQETPDGAKSEKRWSSWFSIPFWLPEGVHLRIHFRCLFACGSMCVSSMLCELLYARFLASLGTASTMNIMVPLGQNHNSHISALTSKITGNCFKGVSFYLHLGPKIEKMEVWQHWEKQVSTSVSLKACEYFSNQLPYLYPAGIYRNHSLLQPTWATNKNTSSHRMRAAPRNDKPRQNMGTSSCSTLKGWDSTITILLERICRARLYRLDGLLWGPILE